MLLLVFLLCEMFGRTYRWWYNHCHAVHVQRYSVSITSDPFLQPNSYRMCAVPYRATNLVSSTCSHPIFAGFLPRTCLSSHATAASTTLKSWSKPGGCVQHIPSWVLIDTGSSTVARRHGKSAHRRLHTCMFVRKIAEMEEEGNCHLAGRCTDAVHEAHVCGQWWEQLVRLRGGAVRRAVSAGSPARQGGPGDERGE